MEKVQELESENGELHHHTRLRTGVTAPRSYKRLARGSDDDSAIASSRSYASPRQRKMTSHMVDRSAEIDYKMEAQERLIQEQQKTINEPKVLVMKVEGNT